jgi:hypothetical protein
MLLLEQLRKLFKRGRTDEIVQHATSFPSEDIPNTVCDDCAANQERAELSERLRNVADQLQAEYDVFFREHRTK